LIGECVTERIDGTVEVAQPIGYVVEDGRYTPLRVVTEPHDEGEDVPRSPAQDERAQDDSDGTESFTRSVLDLLLLFVSLALSSLALGPSALPRPPTAGLLGMLNTQF